MHRPDITRIAEQSKAKANYLEHMPAGYLILSAVAGVYLGFGITLIFSIGAPFAAAGSPAFKLVMGAAFGIALALVIFAGSELFTGNNMVCAVGALTREISWGTLTWIFAVSLAGNLAGSLGLAWLVAQSGVLSQAPQVDLLMKVAATKMNLWMGTNGPRNPVQLAGLPSSLDRRANHQRRRETGFDFLVSVRLRRERIRAQHC